jgi:hypothetical protein
MIKIVSFEPQYIENVAAVILSIQQTEFEFPISLEAQPDLLKATMLP